MRRPPMLWLALIAVIFAAIACSSSDSASPTPTHTPVDPSSYEKPGPFGVGVTTITMVDTSRPTAPNGTFAGAPDRKLTTDIWYPATGVTGDGRDAALDKSGGPYPLIVFAHGYTASRVQSTQYTRHLASRGYIVASPDFPGSFSGAAGGPRLRAVIDQPRDVSFVIDQMLSSTSEPGTRFASAIDASLIGVTGHSLGGLTAMLTEYGPFRDQRVKAFLPISPPACFLDADVIGDVSTPIMVLGGSEELIVDPSSIRQGYDLAHAPRYFVELGGADHIKFADIDLNDRDLGGSMVVSRVAGDTLISDALAIADAIGGNAGPCVTRNGPKGKELITGSRQRELLRLFGALFFDAYLKNDSNALALLRGGDLKPIAPEAAIEFQ